LIYGQWPAMAVHCRRGSAGGPFGISCVANDCIDI
jgi:hypothetical protein